VPTFYLAAAALAVVAVLMLLRPWWQARFSAGYKNSEADAMRALNTAIYRDQLIELERDRNAGQLAEADYIEARDELQQRLLEDTRPTDTQVAVKSMRGLWIALALLIPIAGAGLYSVLGSPNSMLTAAEQDARAAASMEKMVAQLARRMEEKPDNPEGWVMLARSYASMGRFDDGEKAFGRIGPALEQNPELLAAFAEFLVRKADGDFSGRPRELIAKVLKLDPENLMGLYLAGADSMQNERWSDAIRFWEPLLKKLEPGSDDAETVSSGLEFARKKVGAGKTAATGGKTVSGRVELAPALRAKASPDDVLFIFVRSEGGSPMPLAALRLKVSQLPYDFSLSDANALGNAKLSDASALRIEAKVAKSGSPVTAPGDLLGKSSVVKPGAKNLRITIDSEAK
jgi:cytochrome c-type biogenesis protein CcmH